MDIDTFETGRAIRAMETHLENIASALVDIAEQTAYTYLFDQAGNEAASILYRVHNATGKVERYTREHRWIQA